MYNTQNTTKVAYNTQNTTKVAYNTQNTTKVAYNKQNTTKVVVAFICFSFDDTIIAKYNKVVKHQTQP